MTIHSALTPAYVRQDLFGLGGSGKGKPCGEGWISSRLNCGNAAVNAVYETGKAAQGRARAEIYNTALRFGAKSNFMGRSAGVAIHKLKNPAGGEEAYQGVFSIRDKVGLFIAGEARQGIQGIRNLGLLPRNKRLFSVQVQLGASHNAADNKTLTPRQRVRAVRTANKAFDSIIAKMEPGTVLVAVASDEDHSKEKDKRSLYKRVGFKSISEDDQNLYARVGKSGKLDPNFNPTEIVRKVQAGRTIRERKQIERERAERERYSRLTEAEKAEEIRLAIERQNEDLARARAAMRRRTISDSICPPSSVYFDKKCGKSGIPDNRKCTKPTTGGATQSSGGLPAPLKVAIAAAGITVGAYLVAKARYRSNISQSAVDAVKRSKGVNTTLKARQKRIVFCVPGASGSESIQKGEGVQAAWQKGMSPEKNKKDEKTIMVDTRSANINLRDTSDASPQEIVGMHLSNQLKGRNEAAVGLASQIIAFRKAHPDKQITIVGHSYGGAIAEEALAIVSRTKTNTDNIVSIGLGTNNYGLLDGMISPKIKQVTLGSPNDPFTTRGPTKNLRNITTVKGHSLRDYSSDRQVRAYIRNLLLDQAPIMKKDSAARLDKKCGASGIPENATCHKGGSWPAAASIAAGLTAGGLAAYALTRGGSAPSAKTQTKSGPPRLPGLTPRALLKPAPPRQSKTQRMRSNTAAAVRKAEGAISQTAREEVRRVGQIGNTMAATGEAAGMAVKTSLRELRLRTEAARRRFEPGYRAPDQRRLPGGVQSPLNTQATEREGIPIDPRTGQPRRRRAQGFGRRDNYIQHYAPTLLQPPLRSDADDGKKYTKTVTNPETGRKNKVRYGAKGYKIAPGTNKGDRYCARSFGDMKSHGKNCAGEDRNTPLCLSRAKWKCSGKTSRR